MAGLVWFVSDYGMRGEEFVLVAFVMTIAIAGLMVSNVRFYSFKDLDLRGRVPFMTILVVVVMFVFVSSDPPLVLFLGMLAYVGPDRSSRCGAFASAAPRAARLLRAPAIPRATSAPVEVR